MSALIANEVTLHPKYISGLLVKVNGELVLVLCLSLSLSLSLIFTNNWQLKNKYLLTPTSLLKLLLCHKKYMHGSLNYRIMTKNNSYVKV